MSASTKSPGYTATVRIDLPHLPGQSYTTTRDYRSSIARAYHLRKMAERGTVFELLATTDNA